MKRISKIVLALVTAVSLFGCKNQMEKEEIKKEPSSSLSKTYISMINLQKNAAEAGIEAVSKYVDLGDISARALNTENLDISEIGKYLPNDLTTLTRKVEKLSRNAEIENEEISLQDELTAITENFNKEFQSLIPNPEKALTLPFVSSTEDGLKIGDDMIIPFKSIEGAVTVEILNALADGEDIENLLYNFEKELESSFEFTEESARGLWKVNTVAWNKGIINYRWGSISTKHKNAVRSAMTEWNTKTNGKVSFKELENDAWTEFQLGILAIGYVTIKDSELPAGVLGSSSVGYFGGNFAQLKLDCDISGTEVKTTALHELGHTLGLMHEHQRYDRDDYLILTENQLKDTTNFSKIPKETSDFRWRVKAVRVGFWTVNIYYPVFWNTTESYITGSFDFDSIMLYSGLNVKPDKINLNSGNKKTRTNICLSENDIQMIKNRY